MSKILGSLQKMVQAKPARLRPLQGMLLTLEVGSSRVKMALLERKDENVTLHKFGWREVSQADMDGCAHALEELLKELQPPHYRVATSITGPSVAVRYIELPRMTPDEIKSSMQYEAEKYIPFKADEIILDTQVLSEEGTKSQVLLVAARKQLIENRVKLLKRVGLEPFLVDVDAFCLVNAFVHNYGTPSGTVALLHVGAETTTINVIRNGILSFTRDIRIAGHHATRTIAERMGVALPEAERIKLEPAGRAAQVRDAQQSFFEDFLNEIRLSFDFFENKFEDSIKRVWLSGGASGSPDLRRALDEGLRIEIMPWNPLEKITCTAKPDPAQLDEWTRYASVCVGLSVRNA